MSRLLSEDEIVEWLDRLRKAQRALVSAMQGNLRGHESVLQGLDEMRVAVRPHSLVVEPAPPPRPVVVVSRKLRKRRKVQIRKAAARKAPGK